MPLTYPIAVKNRLKIGGIPIWLLDVLTYDNTAYYFSEIAGSYAAVIGGGTQQYSAWITSAGPIKIARDTRTDAADVSIQNLSGNTIERDMWKAIANHEFEGALAILRMWLPLEDYALREFHSSMTETDSDPMQVSFRLTQLQDPNAYVAPVRVDSEQCPWRYKSALCGSTSGLATCPKTRAACVTRVAIERFGGVPYAPPATTFGTVI
jgi:phage-related protein